MKLLKRLAVAVFIGIAALSLMSCSNVSEDYADKINQAYEEDKKETRYTYEQVMKDLGDQAIDVTVEVLGYRTGFIYAMKDCKSKEEMEAKIKSGEGYERLVITIADGVATAADYEVVEPSK